MENVVETKDHEVIRQWADERNGVPAIVRNTESPENGGGILRIKFDENQDLMNMN